MATCATGAAVGTAGMPVDASACTGAVVGTSVGVGSGTEVAGSTVGVGAGAVATAVVTAAIGLSAGVGTPPPEVPHAHRNTRPRHMRAPTRRDGKPGIATYLFDERHIAGSFV